MPCCWVAPKRLRLYARCIQVNVAQGNNQTGPAQHARLLSEICCTGSPQCKVGWPSNGGKAAPEVVLRAAIMHGSERITAAGTLTHLDGIAGLLLAYSSCCCFQPMKASCSEPNGRIKRPRRRPMEHETLPSPSRSERAEGPA